MSACNVELEGRFMVAKKVQRGSAELRKEHHVLRAAGTRTCLSPKVPFCKGAGVFYNTISVTSQNLEIGKAYAGRGRA